MKKTLIAICLFATCLMGCGVRSYQGKFVVPPDQNSEAQRETIYKQYRFIEKSYWTTPTSILEMEAGKFWIDQPMLNHVNDVSPRAYETFESLAYYRWSSVVMVAASIGLLIAGAKMDNEKMAYTSLGLAFGSVIPSLMMPAVVKGATREYNEDLRERLNH